MWIKGLLSELEIYVTKPAILHCDNKAAILIAENPMFHERTKHIEIDCRFVRENIQDDTILPSHVNTKHQLADILTKTLTRNQHYIFLQNFGVYNLFERRKKDEEQG